MWNQAEIKKHEEACQKLDKIKNSAFEFIKNNKNISEYDVQKFILGEFKKYKLKNDVDVPIVAFNASSASPHYFPNKIKHKKLKKNSLIMLDIWARLVNSPYSDITWMAYYGKVSKKITEAFDVVKEARDTALQFIKSSLEERKMPIGSEVNEITQGILLKNGYEKSIRHGIGHSIGFASPHGVYGHINSRNKKELKKNIGYTIEPGVYLDKKFGVRSEINFYINKNMKLIVTTPVQNQIIKI